LTLGGAAAALAAALAVLLLQQVNRAGPAASQDGITIYFSPRGGVTGAVVERISQAQRTVLVQAYSFTSKPIAQALLEAHSRGVKVTVILDSEQRASQYSEATFLHNYKVPVYIDDKHAIAHNKIIILDGRTVITGSFNFTRQAEDSNAENLLVIDDKYQIVQAYEENFRRHLEHSEAYAR